jgi:hypothetical protein
MSKLLAVAKARASVSALVGGCCCCCGGGVSSCACCARSITRLLSANLRVRGSAGVLKAPPVPVQDFLPLMLIRADQEIQ